MAFIGPWEVAFVFFLLLPIILAIKYPAFRVFLGTLMVIIGLLEVTALGWLFGIGWIIGLPTLFVGFLFIALGWPSRKEVIIREKVIQENSGGMFYCKYCGTRISSDSVFCKKCGKAQR
jgi:hypothetical protein